MAPAEPEPVRKWLDEVRAQRHAGEERRRADKETRDARQRWIDPWGAAQKEAREQEAQRRHDAFLEHIERDRNAFRNQAPWGPEQAPWLGETSGPRAQSPGSAADVSTEAPEYGVPHASTYPLPGWNNRWYYRGY